MGVGSADVVLESVVLETVVLESVVFESVALETVVLVELVDVVELVIVEVPGSKMPLLSRCTFSTSSLLQHGVSPLRQQ